MSLHFQFTGQSYVDIDRWQATVFERLRLNGDVMRDDVRADVIGVVAHLSFPLQFELRVDGRPEALVAVGIGRRGGGGKPEAVGLHDDVEVRLTQGDRRKQGGQLDLHDVYPRIHVLVQNLKQRSVDTIEESQIHSCCFNLSEQNDYDDDDGDNCRRTKSTGLSDSSVFV